MRITFVLPDAGMGGGVRGVAMYAKLLAARGHSVTCVSTPPKPVSFRRRLGRVLRGEDSILKSRPRPTHLDNLPAVTHTIIDRHRAISAADVPDADVVIATWWETAEWVQRLPESKGAKVYFVQHHEVVFDNQPVPRVEATYRLPWQKICCAQWLADLMRLQYNDPLAVCVPYGLDHALFNAPPRGKQKRPTVGFMYATARFKAIDVVIEALNSTARNIPNLKIKCFGQKPPIADLPLPPGAEFEQLPTQERIAEIYASCDAWLMPSRCEGFGMPVLEAMGCRTPVIGTKTGVMPEAIGEDAGIIIPTDDAGELEKAIERMSRMKEDEWRAMSDAAHASAARYRWESSAKLFENALTLAVHRAKEDPIPASAQG